MDVLMFFIIFIQTNLVKQFTIIVEKILRAGRVDTAKLVTVLEIVEREER